MADPGKTDRPVAVTLGVGSATYQKGLPEALLTRCMLRRLLRFGPDLQKIAAQFTLAHYQDRIIALYNSVAERRDATISADPLAVNASS